MKSDVGSGIALYQRATESKGKEGPVARQLIELLALDKAIVTLDALHCQKETLKLITQRGGDFIVGIKRQSKYSLPICKIAFCQPLR